MFLACSELILQYTAAHLDPDLRAELTHWMGVWLNGNIVVAIGIWSLAVSIPSLVSLFACRSLPGVCPSVRFKLDTQGLLSMKLDARALYTGCAIAGLLCLAHAQNAGIFGALQWFATIAITLGVPICLLIVGRNSNPDGNRIVLVVTVFCVSIACYVYSLCSAVQWPIGLTRTFLLGSGLFDDGDRSMAAFLGEQGFITWIAAGLILIMVVLRSLRSLSHTLHQEAVSRAKLASGNPLASAQPELALVSTSLITIAVFSVYGLLFTNQLTILMFSLAVASLFIAVPRQQSSHPRHVKLSLSVAGVFIVGISIWMIEQYSLVENLLVTTPGNFSPSYCSWSDTPAVVRNALRGIPVRPTSAQDHLLIRYFCTANVCPPDSMAAVIAIQRTHAYGARNPFSAVSVFLTETIIGMLLTDERIKEIYLNSRSYGASSSTPRREVVGISGAAASLFHTTVGELNDTQSRYLIMSYPATSESSFYFRSPLLLPVSDAPAPLSYTYLELVGLPDMNFMMHGGQINDRGRVASSVLTFNSGMQPFNWQVGHFEMLKNPSGEPKGITTGINDSGVSVGANGDGIRWDNDGTAHDLGLLPGYIYNLATSINNRGQIVGYCYNQTSTASAVDNASDAYLWENGALRDLGVPVGYISTRAYAINNAGLIAGFAITSSGKSHAVVWEDGQMHDLGTYPDGDISRAMAINDAGDVVGQGTHDDGTVTAFLWRAGVMHDLGVLPGDIFTRARSINNHGAIIGESRRETTSPDTTGGRCFIWDVKHGMRDLMPMTKVDASQQHALDVACAVFSINNQGQILGINRRYPAHPGKEANFVLTPVNNTDP